MIINVILFALIGLSCFGLGVVIYKKLAVLNDLSEEEITILSRKKGIVEKVKGVDYKHYWLGLIVALEKFLTRIKILFIKLENFLGRCIKGLRVRSQIMTQKSREWIRWRELKRRSKDNHQKEDEGVAIKIRQDESPNVEVEQEDLEVAEAEEDLPLDELKKPIKEEQKWIDLIVENPKNITAYKFLGLLYWKQHNYADAKASLEMAVKLGSKDKKALEVLEELRKAEIGGEGQK